MKRRHGDITREDVANETVTQATSVKRQTCRTRPEVIMDAHCAQLDFNRTFKQPYSNYELLEYILSISDVKLMDRMVQKIKEHAENAIFVTLEELKKSL